MIESPPIFVNDILPHLTQDEYFLVQSILWQGRLKSAQPQVDYEFIQKGPVRVKRPKDKSGRIAYLWRAVAYQISPYKRDLAQRPDWRMYLTSAEAAVRLDEIAELICQNVPKQYHYGLIARGQS